ncbi:MAG: AmmeMemoRadiSam system radical SAM enzyme [Pirellulaceae bacterium]|nr:AmmeMemoRadiSam system radical SAM enzyme [Pirellulaceae bacterium]
MSQVVVKPPDELPLADGSRIGGWWHTSEDERRIVCDLCPRSCALKPGDRGFCFVRENRDGRMVLATYGRSTGFCVDPIEKKPLNHFYPGSSVLSFGTAGCNLGCKFCQNWDISKSKEVSRLSELATPETIARAARELGCASVAYTYNDPVIWAEYAIDTARACRAVGVKSVAVTAGYITPLAREAFFREMDAANVDLKAFTEEFYFKLTYSHLQPVLDTLRWLKHETDVWFEITNLIIPGENDSPDEFRQMCDWVLDAVGAEVPLHFTAFHPDFRMQDKPRTPVESLLAAREIALRQGVKYAYTGNVDDVKHQSTYCPHCGGLLIARNWYDLGAYHLRGDRCGHCGGRIAGRFAEQPGDWGRKRLPVRISQFATCETGNDAGSATPGARPSFASSKQEPPTMTDSRPTTMPANNVAASPTLTEEQRRAIHRAACEVVAAGVRGVRPQRSDAEMAGAATQPVMGAFVTLKRAGKLRACCGTLGQPMPLKQAVEHAALRTATEDSRFPTISPIELPHLHLDVTLLYAFQPIAARGRNRIAEVEIGRHGLQIQRGNQAGLLLPSVPIEWGWDAETFLQQVCRKAGLPTTAWLDDDTRLLKFEGRMIEGDFCADVAGTTENEQPPRFSAAEMAELAEQCRRNVVALTRGATPNYYLPGCPDGSVELVCIAVGGPGIDPPMQFSQMSLRPGVPLQATLFQLAEAAARALQQRRVGESDLNRLSLDLTVLADPAMHGTVADADLTGIETSRRAILVIEQSKTAWCFDPDRSPRQLLATAVADAHVVSPEASSVFSLAVLSTEARSGLSSVPRPVAGPQVRPAAVAGMFYPDDPRELAAMVDRMVGNGDVQPEDWPAVMVPHAGLIYSGQLAARTLKRVKIPSSVIVIGPKHTRLGVDWAVAPHDAWALPGGSLAADPALARRLVEGIPGLKLDAAAHQQEHAIEVELPFLARLAPHSRVTGIAIGPAGLAGCREFAAGLAAVLRELPERPLLVVSSDMNHFANDTENRRLDEIALQSIETLDPEQVFDTVVTRNNISMCGVRPCVIVMETLRQLGLLRRCQRVGYSTSADVSGDKHRVVGYAGMLFG